MIAPLITTLVAIAMALATVKIVAQRNLFARMRLLALSAAAQSEAIGGVGVSILCPSPKNIDVVRSLLSCQYPKSEVVVTLNTCQRINLIAHLILRYSLTPQVMDKVVVYRSSKLCYRRLVLVATAEHQSLAELINLAAEHTLHNYLLTLPNGRYLMPNTISYMVQMLTEHPLGNVDVVTTNEKNSFLVSRTYWHSVGGFPFSKKALPDHKMLHIDYPMTTSRPLEIQSLNIAERAEYNFFDFLALNIMKLL